ncbi:universal stress protein [Sulfitobacter mediterraneus]|uniref:universal stress protein n=1 Tax=Sulfitobacter mediterraneus TaxID=83219 RepID=UPI000EA1E083|nr:universal stress protein [Sulfitobacter mediterraneus]
MYKNILIPVLLDDDQAKSSAVQVAKALAENGATFTVLHVMEAIPAYVTIEIPAEVLANTRKEVEEGLSAISNELPNCLGVTISGHAGNSIVEYAKKHDIDCIVLASHKPGLQNFFLGSTADRVVRHAACAVHVLR